MISSLIGGIKQHISQLPHTRTHKDGRHGIKLVSEHGEMIEGYDMIFRELFCLAAAALADRLREDLASIGVLWDEILPTGSNGRRTRPQLRKSSSAGIITSDGSDANEDSHSSLDLAEKGVGAWQQAYGRGSLMFLVRRTESDRDSERLVSAGYRFAELHQVSDIIRSSMQIQSHEFETKLRDMSTYTGEQNQNRPGVHLGFFAIRARVSSGFEILVRQGARNLLPTMPLPLNSLEDWHMHYLAKFDNMSVSKIAHKCKEDSQRSTREAEFAGQLTEAIESLREWAQEPLFDDAVLTSTTVRIPCRGEEGRAEATMIAMRLVIPIHSVLSSPNCEFVPLGFFKMCQVSEKFHQEFARGVHREFGHVIKAAGRHGGSPGSRAGLPSNLWPFGRSDSSKGPRRKGKSTPNIVERRTSSPDSTRSSSTINLCPPSYANRTRSIDSTDGSGIYQARDGSSQAAPSYGGIMVFQEITIDVEGKEAGRVQSKGSESSDTMTIEKTSPAAGIELQSMGHIGTNVQAQVGARNGPAHFASFVDVLFAETVESR